MKLEFCVNSFTFLLKNPLLLQVGLGLSRPLSACSRMPKKSSERRSSHITCSSASDGVWNAEAIRVMVVKFVVVASELVKRFLEEASKILIQYSYCTFPNPLQSAVVTLCPLSTSPPQSADPHGCPSRSSSLSARAHLHHLPHLPLSAGPPEPSPAHRPLHPLLRLLGPFLSPPTPIYPPLSPVLPP